MTISQSIIAAVTGAQMTSAEAEAEVYRCHARRGEVTTEKLRLEVHADRARLDGHWPNGSLEEKYNKLARAVIEANDSHTRAVEQWRAIQLREQREARAAAREKRHSDKAAGRLPDVAGARKALADASAAVAAETDRLQQARVDLAAAQEKLGTADPESRDFAKVVSAHGDAERKVAAHAHRLQKMQGAEAAARTALADTANHDAVSSFDLAADDIEDAGDRFTTAAQAARMALAEELAKFNAALATAAELYGKLPMDCRSGRSPHSAHRLGEIFGSGGTTDVFMAASHAIKRGLE